MPNLTGHYEYVPSKGWVKTSEAIPTLAPHVWTPKGDLPYYDNALRMRIESKAHKRQIMREAGIKEAGIILNPDKRWEGHTKNGVKPTLEQRNAHAKRQAWIQAQGGTQGLLDRLQRGGRHG